MKKVLNLLLIALTIMAVGTMDATAAKKKTGGKKSGGTTSSAVIEYTPQRGIAENMYPVFIELYAPGYAPSTRFKSTFAQAASRRKGKAEFYRMNVEKYPSLAQEMNVYELPYVVVISGPDSYASFSGEIPLQYLLQMMDQVIDTSQNSYYYGY